jgi:hypothetical protein
VSFISQYLKYAIDKRLKVIAQNSNTYYMKLAHIKEKNLFRTIKDKLQLQDLSTAKADKGKTVVILNTAEYSNK